MKNEKKVGLITLVIVLVLVIIGLGGFIIYDKVLQKNKTENNNSNSEINNTTNSNEKNLSEAKKAIETIVEEELYVLWNKNSIDEISNQEKLQIALERYAKDNNLDLLLYQPEVVSAKELENSYYKTSCSNNPLVHQNIYLYNKVFSSTDVLYTYDANTKTYNVNPVGKGMIKIEPTYSKVIDFKIVNENNYSISYQYLFTWINHGDVDNNVYFSYNDAKNQVNGIKVFDINGTLNSYDELKLQLDEYVEKNYDKIKDKLITHNYEFSYESGKYNLKKFYLS